MPVMALAASGTGMPLPCPMPDLFAAARLEEEQAADPASWAAMLGEGRSEAEQQRLDASIVRLIAERAPIRQRLVVLSSSVSPAF